MKPKLSLSVVFFVLVSLLVLPSAHATAGSFIGVVTKTTDGNDGVCDSDCSLREAIAYVEGSDESSDTIAFDPSLAGQTVTVGSKLTIDVSATGPLTINPNAGVVDDVTIDAGGSTPLLEVAGGQVTINRTTLRGGRGANGANGTGANGGGGGGAAITSDAGATLAIADSTVEANTGGNGGNGGTGAGGGGGAGAISNEGNMLFIRSTVADNVGGNGGTGGAGASSGLQGAGGGGAGAGAVTSTNGSLQIVDSTFSGNTGGNGGAGGSNVSNGGAAGGGGASAGTILADAGAALSVENSTIAGNTSGLSGAGGASLLSGLAGNSIAGAGGGGPGSGGGGGATGAGGTGPTGNGGGGANGTTAGAAATGHGGGGAPAFSSPDVIAGGSAAGDGGAAGTQSAPGGGGSGGSSTGRSNDVPVDTGLDAGGGGGGFGGGGGGGYLNEHGGAGGGGFGGNGGGGSCAGNGVAGGGGGGAGARHACGGGSASDGGGALAAASSDVDSTILADSVNGSASPVEDCRGTLVGSANVIENPTHCTHDANDQTGDPGLAALSNNGGPTLTMAITKTSNAFDHGSNPGALGTDQRGIARVWADAPDAGAYELRPQQVDGFIAGNPPVGYHIYNTTADGQKVVTKVRPHRTATFTIGIDNDGEYQDTITVSAPKCKSSAKFAVHIVDVLTSTDITSAVNHGAQQYILSPVDHVTLTLTIKSKRAGAASKGCLINLISQTGASDAVKPVARVI